MGILDEAIREHLELKRQHGAGDSELKQLEDEAFGQAERPGEEHAADPLAEAPTEFMEQPETAEAEGLRREPTIADLQEPPPPAEEPAPAQVETPAEEAAAIVDEPPVEEPSAMEHEIVAEPTIPDDELAPAGPSTEERQAIAEQPTEMFDVEQELGSQLSPTDEELVEEEIAEPRLAPTDPLAGLAETEEAEVSVQGPAPDDDDEYDDEDDAFWNEQRLSDELDQALEAPRDPEPEATADPDPEPEITAEPEPELTAEPEPEEEPASEEYEEPESAEESAPVAEAEGAEPPHDEDVLEETPDFLEETPEDDQLWFEQKPPKDFDFDD